MQPFYPAIKTYAEHKIKVEPPHVIYVEECGNPDGIPIIVVHGGPGAGCEAYHRRFFDPEKYRIILFDQRGAGRSKPHAALENNSTGKLIADIETIRNHLNIDHWALFGGSWGAALSLLYTQIYPQHVTGLILHSIFLARPKDILWFYQNGANHIFPDYWEDFISAFSKEERQDLIHAYHQRLTGGDELARMATAKSWSLWQARCNALQPHTNIIDHFSDPRFAIGLATIESHYFMNNCFINDNQILDNMTTIKNIPGYIIHGRYDIPCPLQAAWELKQHWPAAELYIVRDAGHLSREPGIIDALILATNKFAHGHSKSA